VREQKWTLLTNPSTELASVTRDNKGVAFLFFPGNEQYQQMTHELFPGGKNGEVTSRSGETLVLHIRAHATVSTGDAEITFRFGST